MPTRAVRHGAARIGLAAKATLYALLAVLVAQIAFNGPRGSRADTHGALRTVAQQPFGTGLLIALTIGFGLYAAWQWWCVIDGDDTKARVTAAGRGLLWAGLSYTASRFVVGSPGDGGQEESLTAWLLSIPFGTWLVAAAGATIVIVSLALLRHLRDREYLDHLRPMPYRTRRAVEAAAVVGITARTGVYSLAGAFLVRAALHHDPNTGVGLDGALSQVAKSPYGPYALLASAAGLAAYALWCGLRARFEDVDRSDG